MAIGAISSSFDWLSKLGGTEETGGTLASKGTEETSGTVAKSEGNLFDGRECNDVDGSVFANNDRDLNQEETSGTVASGGFCAIA